jgi:two-component system, OmpR family, phosphate regulon response regulator PhoB
VTTMTENAEKPLVLVADDDPDILSLVSLRLEKAGYEVVTATDGRQAFEVIREQRPAAAILDVRMPEMDGLEVMRSIRADEESKDMILIALSARVREANIAEGLEAGADEYMQKPFSGKQLIELIEAKLPKKSS